MHFLVGTRKYTQIYLIFFQNVIGCPVQVAVNGEELERNFEFLKDDKTK